jgi:putative DNA primase/helicase
VGLETHVVQPPGRAEPPTFDTPPRPISGELLPVPRLDAQLIPAPLRGWLEDIAARGCFPPEYPVAAAIVALSSLVGRKLAIRPKRHDDWLVVPNLWGAIVGPPGIQNSPPMEEAMRPLRRLVAEALKAHTAALQEHAVASKVAGARAKAAKKALEKAAENKKTAEEALRTLAREAEGAKDKEPAPRRYETNDPTVEKLGELLKDNPNGLLLFRDELTGFLRTLDKEGHEADRGFYLESWSGTGGYTYDRIGRGTIIIPAVCMSIFGTIQPGPLARDLRAAATVDNDGLMNRFQVLLYPDPPKTWKNIDRYPDTVAKSQAYAVFQGLDSLDAVAVGAEKDEDRGIPFLRFARDAQELFDDWRTELENRLRSGTDIPVIQCHLAKYRSLLPSLALLFHLVDVVGGEASGPVTLRSAEAAEEWCALLEAHARRLYLAALEGDPGGAVRLAERLKNSLPNPFRVRQVVQKGWSGLDTTEAAERAVGILEDRGWLKGRELPAGPQGGRPATEYWIHPDICGRGGDGVL